MGKLEVGKLDMWTLPDVVSALKVSRAAVYRWVETGELKAYKVGALLRFRPEDVEAFMVEVGAKDAP